MDQTQRDIITALITYAAMGAIGYTQAHRFKRPIKVSFWISLVIVAIALGYVLPSAYALSVFGIDVHFSWILQAFVLGLLAGLVLRELRQRKPGA